MQTNTRGIVSGIVGIVILVVTQLIPSIGEQLNLIATPVTEIIMSLLLLYAGIQTGVPALGAQKVVT